jgi:hypothetical protein
VAEVEASREAVPTVNPGGQKAEYLPQPSEPTPMTHEFKPNIERTFTNGNDIIVVRTLDESHGHYWQMEVNESKSEVSGHYMGVLAHKDYYYCTAYWTGVFPVNTPFTITKAVRMTHMDQPQLPSES